MAEGNETTPFSNTINPRIYDFHKQKVFLQMYLIKCMELIRRLDQEGYILETKKKHIHLQ